MAKSIDTSAEEASAQENRKPAPRNQPAKKRRLWLILGVVLVIGAAAGYYVWNETSQRQATDDAQIDGHISPISARVSGTVISVAVVDYQQVAEGQTLFQIDPTDYKVQVDQAAAELADAEAAAKGAQSSVPVTSISANSNISTAEAGVREAAAGVAVAREGVGTAEAKLKSAQAKLQEAEANATKASKDLERYRLLVDKDEISRQQFDAAVASADSARATVESNRASVAEAG